jgi:hypothetical protein
MSAEQWERPEGVDVWDWWALVIPAIGGVIGGLVGGAVAIGIGACVPAFIYQLGGLSIDREIGGTTPQEAYENRVARFLRGLALCGLAAMVGLWTGMVGVGLGWLVRWVVRLR